MKAITNSFLIALCIACIGLGQGTLAQEKKPSALSGVGIIEEIGTPLPPNLHFTNEEGKTVTLDDYLKQKRPLILNLVYFKCPMLCNLVVTGLVDSLKKIDNTTLSKFDVLTISFNPEDSFSDALGYKQKYIKELNKPAFNSQWHFLVGDADNIQQLTKAVGFQYKYLPDQKEFSHPSAIILIDRDGKIVRYLNGVEYNPFDVKMALLEGQKSKPNSAIDQVLLFCYNYDPGKNSYVLQARTLMKIGGLITIVLLATLIFFSRKKGS